MQSANLIISFLLYIAPTRQILYITDTTMGKPSHRFEHLSCFASGMFALGVYHSQSLGMTEQEKELHLWAAKGLPKGCVVLYEDQEGGFGPDKVTMKRTKSDEELEKRK
jgi:hypothetical protein